LKNRIKIGKIEIEKLNKRWKLELKLKIEIKCDEGPTRNKKWGILKYLSAEISSEKSEIIQDHRTRVSGVLGQNLGYDIIVLQCDRFQSFNFEWLSQQKGLCFSQFTSDEGSELHFARSHTMKESNVSARASTHEHPFFEIGNQRPRSYSCQNLRVYI